MTTLAEFHCKDCKVPIEQEDRNPPTCDCGKLMVRLWGTYWNTCEGMHKREYDQLVLSMLRKENTTDL